jgi:Fe-Mn family superoxide dismutase
MQKFEEIKFEIKGLKGISDKNIEEHLKLYSGYVKNANLILEHIEKLSKNSEEFAYELGEIQRRFGFEYNGMRNHEIYFSSLSQGVQNPNTDSPLYKKIEATWGSFDAWLHQFKSIALTRGIGWAILYYDKKADRLLTAWVDEQHLGQLQDCTPVLALDMWEHSYVADYLPSGKKQYVEDFFESLNWQMIEQNFQNTL